MLWRSVSAGSHSQTGNLLMALGKNSLKRVPLGIKARSQSPCLNSHPDCGEACLWLSAAVFLLAQGLAERRPDHLIAVSEGCLFVLCTPCQLLVTATSPFKQSQRARVLDC